MKERYLRLVRRTYRVLRHKRLRDKEWWQKLTRPLFDRRLWRPCRDSVATGLAIGLFFAMMLMPFQMVAAALIAMRSRGNVPIAMAACWITNVFTHVPVWIAQEWFGGWLRNSLGVPMPSFIERVHFQIPKVGEVNAASFILGMIMSGVILSLLAYPLVHLLAKVMPQYLPVRKSLRNQEAKAGK